MEPREQSVVLQRLNDNNVRTVLLYASIMSSAYPGLTVPSFSSGLQHSNRLFPRHRGLYGTMVLARKYQRSNMRFTLSSSQNLSLCWTMLKTTQEHTFNDKNSESSERFNTRINNLYGHLTLPYNKFPIFVERLERVLPIESIMLV